MPQLVSQQAALSLWLSRPWNQASRLPLTLTWVVLSPANPLFRRKLLPACSATSAASDAAGDNAQERVPEKVAGERGGGDEGRGIGGGNRLRGQGKEVEREEEGVRAQRKQQQSWQACHVKSCLPGTREGASGRHWSQSRVGDGEERK